jgi:hypothetical protein
MKQREELCRKIYGLRLSCKLIYCECSRCSDLGIERHEEDNAEHMCIHSIKNDQVRKKAVDIGVQVNRDCLEEQDMWTDTSQWSLPDKDDVSTTAIDPESNLPLICESDNETNDTSWDNRIQQQHMHSSSSGEYWEKALLQSSRRMPNAIVCRGNSDVSAGYNRVATPRVSVESETSTNPPKKSSVEQLIVKKLDLLCVKLCGNISQPGSGREALSPINDQDESSSDESASDASDSEEEEPVPDTARLNLGTIGAISLHVDRAEGDAGAVLVVGDVTPGRLADLAAVVKRGDVLAAVDGTPLRRTDAPLAHLAATLLPSPRAQRSPVQRLSFRRGGEVYAVDSPRQLLPECVLPPSLMAEALRGRDLQRAAHQSASGDLQRAGDHAPAGSARCSSDRSRSARSTERSPESAAAAAAAAAAAGDDDDNLSEDSSSSPAVRSSSPGGVGGAAASAMVQCATPRRGGVGECAEGGGGGGEGRGVWGRCGGERLGEGRGDVWAAEPGLPQHLVTPRGAAVAEVRSFTF